MMRHRPVAVADRDGFGMILEVEVAARLLTVVPILSAAGELVGLCDRNGIAHWDPRPSLHGPRVADVETRKTVASTGKLVASVDERGRVLALRVEPRGSTPSRARAERYPRGELEYSNHPGRIISVNGRPV